MANNKDLNKIAAAGLRIDRAYNPEAGTTAYGGYNTTPKQTAISGTTGAPSPTGGNTMTGNNNAMTGNNNAMTGNNNAMTGGNAMTGNTAGGVGVRNAMTASGLDNSKIGWNGEYVTYNGANFLKPSTVVNGTSFTSRADFENAFKNYMGTQGLSGVRGALTAAGLDNGKIGWNDGYVTYDGQNLIKPSTVLNGTSYASQADIDKAVKGYMGTQGLSGVREMLVSRGISDDRIGWNPETGNVTIDGKDVLKPETIIGDRSYAQDTDINKLTDTAYANSGDPIRMAKAYVAQFGLQNAVNWADGKLTIGGIDVPVMYNQDGNAFAKQSDIDNAVAQVKANSGIVGNKQVYDNWKSEYGDRINSMLDTLINRDKWSYNPDTDPAYLAYRDMYTREGNRAYQDAYASMAANTGGYGSSASSTAAGQQLNYYMQQLNDRIPELEQNDYNRWYNDQLLNREAFNSLISAADSDYNKLYQANRDAISDTNNANYYNYLRDKDAKEFNRDVYESDRDYNRDVLTQDREWAYLEQLKRDEVTQSNIDTKNHGKLSDLNVQKAELEVEDERIGVEMDKMQYVLSKYTYSADYNKQISAADAEVLGISPKADGTYPTIMDVQVAYSLLEDAKNSPYYTLAKNDQQKEVTQIQRNQLQQQRTAAGSILTNGIFATVNSGAFDETVTNKVEALTAAAQQTVTH